MSILAAAADDVLPPNVMVILGVLATAMLLGAKGLGAFKPREETVLRGLFTRQSVVPLLLNMILTVVAYFGAAMLGGAVIGMLDPKALESGQFSSPTLIALTCVVSVVAWGAMLVGLIVFVPNGLRRVGLAGRPILRGVGFALVALMCCMPMIFLVSSAAEWVYQRIGYKHEDAHELLSAMGSTDSLWVRIGAILAAVVIAPVSEEFLFRGHIQTLLRRLFTARGTFPVASPVPVEQQVGATVYSSSVETMTGSIYTPPALPYATPVTVLPPAEQDRLPSSTFWPSVAAVVVTSMLFAAVHPIWSWPAIFVLSLYLGFAYERRHNLWTCIALHALFNGLMTCMFLFMQMGKS